MELAQQQPERDRLSLYDAINEVVYGDENTAAGLVDEHLETIEEMYDAWSRLKTIRKAAWQVSDAIENAIKRELRGRAWRMDDWLFWAKPEAPTMHVRDGEGLKRYLDLSDTASKVFAASSINLTALRQIARDRDHGPDAVINKFFEWKGEPGPPKLRVFKMEYAPWWCMKPPILIGEFRTPPDTLKGDEKYANRA